MVSDLVSNPRREQILYIFQVNEQLNFGEMLGFLLMGFLLTHNSDTEFSAKGPSLYHIEQFLFTFPSFPGIFIQLPFADIPEKVITENYLMLPTLCLWFRAVLLMVWSQEHHPRAG